MSSSGVCSCWYGGVSEAEGCGDSLGAVEDDVVGCDYDGVFDSVFFDAVGEFWVWLFSAYDGDLPPVEAGYGCLLCGSAVFL